MGLTLQQLQQEGATPIQNNAPSASGSMTLDQLQKEGATPVTPAPNLLDKLGGRMQQSWTGIKNAYNNIPDSIDAISHPLTQGNKMTIGTDILHAGAGAFGAASDIAGAGISAANDVVRNTIPGVAPVENAIGGAINSAKGSAIGQNIQGKINNFSEQNPDVASAFKDFGDFASGVGTVTGAASLYGSAKNALTHRGLLQNLSSVGAENPEGIASTLAEHGIAPGQATWKQGVKVLKDSLSNAQETLPSITTMEGISSMTNHINELQNAIQVLQESGESLYGPALKSTGLIGHLTPWNLGKTIVGAGIAGNALSSGGKFLYNKFVGQSPWSK